MSEENVQINIQHNAPSNAQGISPPSLSVNIAGPKSWVVAEARRSIESPEAANHVPNIQIVTESDVTQAEVHRLMADIIVPPPADEG